ncbi:MAG TPA: hypothetical protein VFP84_29985 [Kofleriaceae bacterium]|nr:hypothetical protein [Kofleriaceae bacterium]
MLGSALVSRDGHRRAPAPHVLDPVCPPAHPRAGGAVLAGRHEPRHMIGI